jgi:Asp-tRNA(Asn)/Glu-tRNA(Gln) amidotransferase A subunit family amidase
MYTKLTLNITDTVVEKAKRAAKKRKTSVSRLVEDFLNKISEEKEGESVVSFFIKNAPKNKTKPGTEKEIIKAYLKKKHGV